MQTPVGCRGDDIAARPLGYRPDRHRCQAFLFSPLGEGGCVAQGDVRACWPRCVYGQAGVHVRGYAPAGDRAAHGGVCAGAWACAPVREVGWLLAVSLLAGWVVMFRLCYLVTLHNQPDTNFRDLLISVGDFRRGLVYHQVA